MPTTPQKRGGPRKYGSNEEKARRDVLAKRARRHLQQTVAHRDVRFQVYQAPGSSATEIEPAGRLDALADAAQFASQMTTPRRDSMSTELEGNEKADTGPIQGPPVLSPLGSCGAMIVAGPKAPAVAVTPLGAGWHCRSSPSMGAAECRRWVGPAPNGTGRPFACRRPRARRGERGSNTGVPS
ncbi:hypothetical protein PCL_12113 [Purpureocillium lilacinum]|uniref:Uncharacterized protein n=1 Tax=Purpureocillium lilacinum TaxID=33203 RepID=A0A2U3DPG0_PURLI|nr:hypothetical protein PCL_12113 [Purpureocillium lilacinum]